MYSELPIDNGSRLKLSADELQRHYMSHLFLQALGLPNEVSLCLLEIGFRHSKTTLFKNYTTSLRGLGIPNAVVHLNSLPDRFINGVVLYRLATCSSFYGNITNHEYIRLCREAQQLLKERDDKELSADELSTLGRLQFCPTGEVPIMVRHATTISYLKRASLLGSLESILLIAHYYRFGLKGLKADLAEAIRYYKRGYEMGCPESMAQIAHIISRHPSLAPDLSSKTLYQKAASLGHYSAIDECKRQNYPY